MRRIAISACIGLLSLAMAAPSFAADLPRPTYKAHPYPVYAPFTWSGFYFGVNAGYGFGSSNWTNSAISDSLNVKGAVLGTTVGYNFQTGVWVWGLEGDFGPSFLKGSANAAGGVCGGAGCTTENTWFGTARGRVGYGFDRWLPYITGGAAFGNIKMTPSNGSIETANKLGWTLGAGLEYVFSGPWSAKFEYLYADLGKGTCDVTTCGISTDVNLKMSIVRLGLNRKF
jgi:outer membrane immunogenic protein